MWRPLFRLGHPAAKSLAPGAACVAFAAASERCPARCMLWQQAGAEEPIMQAFNLPPAAAPSGQQAFDLPPGVALGSVQQGNVHSGGRPYPQAEAALRSVAVASPMLPVAEALQQVASAVWGAQAAEAGLPPCELEMLGIGTAMDSVAALDCNRCPV